jgi:7,8-dihydro-6-hydroxymethylpterin-pyrophosphokinase
MKITKVSILSKIERSIDLDVTAEQINAWRSGMLIQEAMPHLNEHEREFIMTGITKDEWDNLMEEDV